MMLAYRNPPPFLMKRDDNMTLFEKSLRTIELPRVLDMLKAQAVSEAAKEETEKIFPVIFMNQLRIAEERQRIAETGFTA